MLVLAFQLPQLLSHTPQVNKLSHFLTEAVQGVMGKDMCEKKIVPKLDTQGQEIRQLWRPAAESREAAHALSNAQGVQAIFRMEANGDGILEPTGVTYIVAEGLKHEEAKTHHAFAWTAAAVPRAAATAAGAPGIAA